MTGPRERPLKCKFPLENKINFMSSPSQKEVFLHLKALHRCLPRNGFIFTKNRTNMQSHSKVYMSIQRQNCHRSGKIWEVRVAFLGRRKREEICFHIVSFIEPSLRDHLQELRDDIRIVALSPGLNSDPSHWRDVVNGECLCDGIMALK